MSSGFGKKARWQRAADFASSLAASALYVGRLPGFDLVIAMTSPPLIWGSIVKFFNARWRLVTSYLSQRTSVCAAGRTFRRRKRLARLQTTSSPDAMDYALASLLRGESIEADVLAAPGAEQRVLTMAAEHGVDCLVRHLMKERGTWGFLPSSVRDEFDRRARAETAYELARRGELARIMRGFQQGKRTVNALVLKGAALAYTHYPAPYLRPCTDVDILVSRPQRAAAATALEALGYTRVDSMSRDAVHTQSTFGRKTGHFHHVVDLHWAISNRPLFAAMLSFEELARHAMPVPGVEPSAGTLSPVDALLFACIHRIAHHNDSHRLIWLYDVKLLAESLCHAEWDQFVELATRKQVVAVCRETFRVTAALLDGCEEGGRRFSQCEGSDLAQEPSAAYLGGVGSRFRSLALDLKGAVGAAAKMRLLAGHAFPDPTYLRKKYGVTSRVGLIGAYAHRAAMGAWRTIRLPVARTGGTR